ncbi:Ldh family oxidoreductase [Nitratidesulfovibrio liaohensis]|uniref:Ldh family oxidoreductase n=1 Tax=Nitratidesulfovibrio liaohensis TaxID=2604158 RepID=A0ABY9QYI1_9BACT|nr:Ldh family oxidoreductase [Nitratidesulfovibrio liaohensis]WMW64234.1 Ldh family oxidoreductase [Nitratidesulfovibrio liaohensis]
MTVVLRPDDLEALCRAVLERVGVLPAAASSVAGALVAAECMGIPSHGVARLPQYADQVAAGKVRGDAVPRVETPLPATVRVDAGCGFAYPALEAGLDVAAPLALRMGCAALGVTGSHHCGVAGLHVERAARQGLVALLFANTPAAMAPWGGNRASLGTNPLAFACPAPVATAADSPSAVDAAGAGVDAGAGGTPGAGAERDPLVMDLSLSTVARGKIVAAAREGQPIPEGWAVDAGGNPTTDARAALGGMLLPFGGAKGAALALMVELLAASLTGSNHAYEASSFLDAEGGPPRTGQCMLLIAPQAFGADFAARAAALLGHVLAQPCTRLPGARRFELQRRAYREGVVMPWSLHQDLLRRAGSE